MRFSFLHKQSKTILSGAIIVGFFGLLSRLLGIVRDRILAGQFGAGDILDIYYAGFRIPDFVFNIVGLGALSAAFVPIFISLLKKEQSNDPENTQAWEFVNQLFNLFAIVLIFLSTLAVIFAPWLVKLITPGFSGEKLYLTVQMTRLMFIAPVLFGLGSVLGGVLQSFQRFIAFSVSAIFYNLGIIAGALIFVKWWGIYGLAAGVIAGVVAHIAIYFVTARHLGFHYKPVFNFKNKNVIKLIKLMIPRTFGLVTTQVNFLVITIIGSTLAVGTLTIFNFANNLQFLPIGLISVPFAISVFPVLSRALAKGEKENFDRHLSSTIRHIIFFMVPAFILFIILRETIVRVVLATGAYDEIAIFSTASTLGWFSVSLVAQALIPILSRAFYALQNTVIPFVSALASMIANVILCYWLAQKMGVQGLALAFSLSSILNAGILWIWLRKQAGNFSRGRILKTSLKLILPTLLLIITAFAVKIGFNQIVEVQGFWFFLVEGILVGLAGAGSFILIGYLFKMEEIKSLKRLFCR